MLSGQRFRLNFQGWPQRGLRHWRPAGFRCCLLPFARGMGACHCCSDPYKIKLDLLCILFHS